MYDTDPPWLPLYLASQAERHAARAGVSQIARSGRGFLTAYKLAHGDPNLLRRDPRSEQNWTEVRRRFVNRFLQGARSNREQWWLKSRQGVWRPSRRHLALVMWAHSPTPESLHNWLASQRRSSLRRQGY
jgi:hypothetical protein